MRLVATVAGLALALTGLNASAETIRIAIGTQDTTINCATGGLLIRELKLLEKYLPRDGKYKDAQGRMTSFKREIEPYVVAIDDQQKAAYQKLRIAREPLAA